MIVAMDLNASPLPEDDEETFEEYNAKDYSAQDYSAQEYSAPQEHVESGVDILRRVLFFVFSSLFGLNLCSWSSWSR